MREATESDREATKTLTRLNQEYIDAFMKADVTWYREHLADDFICVDSDGSVLDREEFLKDAAHGPDVATYTLSEVVVRLYGHVALVYATGVFARRDGSAGTSRYTDVYALQDDGKWKTISAQVTRADGKPKGGLPLG